VNLLVFGTFWSRFQLENRGVLLADPINSQTQSDKSDFIAATCRR
jgi:hypothetical protein